MIRFLALAITLAAATPALAGVRPIPSGIESAAGGVTVRVEALTDSILRVRVARRQGLAEDESWAVPSLVRQQRARVSPTRDGFRTSSIEVHLNDNRLRIVDLEGRNILSDAAVPLTLSQSGFSIRKSLNIGDHIY